MAFVEIVGQSHPGVVEHPHPPFSLFQPCFFGFLVVALRQFCLARLHQIKTHLTVIGLERPFHAIVTDIIFRHAHHQAKAHQGFHALVHRFVVQTGISSNLRFGNPVRAFLPAKSFPCKICQALELVAGQIHHAPIHKKVRRLKTIRDDFVGHFVHDCLRDRNCQTSQAAPGRTFICGHITDPNPFFRRLIRVAVVSR